LHFENFLFCPFGFWFSFFFYSLEIDEEWCSTTHHFAARLSQIALTLCSDCSICGLTPDITPALLRHALAVVTSHVLSDKHAQSIVTIAMRYEIPSICLVERCLFIYFFV
jgi:hypothetical protein